LAKADLPITSIKRGTTQHEQTFNVSVMLFHCQTKGLSPVMGGALIFWFDP